MEAKILLVGGEHVLVARPRGHALGLLIADISVAAYVARETQHPLLLLGRPETAGSPLLRLRYEGLTVIDPSGATARRSVRRLRRQALVTAALNAPLAAAQSVVAVTTEFLCSQHPMSPATLVGNLNEARRQADVRINAAVAALQRSCKGVSMFAARWTGKTRQDARHWEMVAVDLLGRWKRTKRKNFAIKDRVRAAAESIDTKLESARRVRSVEAAVHEGHDVRRYAARAPLRSAFAQEDDRAARAAAARAGVPLDRPIVTVHVREGDYKAVAGVEDRGKDSVRNARIQSYGRAVDALVRRGFCVVRIGDPSMPPFTREGVIDLAVDPGRSSLLDFWCVARSHVFIAGDSGPYLLSWLFDVPCLTVNIVNLLGVYPLRARDRYIVKRVREVATGRLLTLEEMLNEDFIYNQRKTMFKDQSIELVDNTVEEIEAAVLEMVDSLENPRPPTPAQLRFRQLIASVREGGVSRVKLAEKVGRNETYLGDGWVIDRFAAELAGSERQAS